MTEGLTLLWIGFFVGWCCHILFVWAFKKEDKDTEAENEKVDK